MWVLRGQNDLRPERCQAPAEWEIRGLRSCAGGSILPHSKRVRSTGGLLSHGIGQQVAAGLGEGSMSPVCVQCESTCHPPSLFSSLKKQKNAEGYHVRETRLRRSPSPSAKGGTPSGGGTWTRCVRGAGKLIHQVLPDGHVHRYFLSLFPGECWTVEVAPQVPHCVFKELHTHKNTKVPTYMNVCLFFNTTTFICNHSSEEFTHAHDMEADADK